MVIQELQKFSFTMPEIRIFPSVFYAQIEYKGNVLIDSLNKLCRSENDTYIANH